MAKKLFKLIACEKEIKSAWEKIRNETLKVFKGASLFMGREKIYQPLKDDGKPLPNEKKEVVTTVEERLAWTAKFLFPLLDYELTRDSGNQKAHAKLTVNGVVIAETVPVTFLMLLEKRLKELREVYDAIPTLDLSGKWETCQNNKKLFQFGPITTYRTEKVTKGVTLAPATDKYPAQVEKVVEDVAIGTFKETLFSGAIQPGVKAKYLERIDQLIAATQTAREDANEEEVTDKKIGDNLVKFIHAD